MKQWALNILLAALAVLAPIKALLISVGFLIVADLVTGIWAAVKQKKPITSAAARRTVQKFLVYQLAVISGFLVETYMLEHLLPVSKIVASVIGLVELKSILENANKILGQDLFKSVVARLGSENDTLKEEIAQRVKEEVKKQLD